MEEFSDLLIYIFMGVVILSGLFYIVESLLNLSKSLKQKKKDWKEIEEYENMPGMRD